MHERRGECACAGSFSKTSTEFDHLFLKERAELGKFYLFNGPAAGFLYQGRNICVYFYVLGNTVLVLILQITEWLQVHSCAILPLPARAWQKVLQGLSSGQAKLETLVRGPLVLHHLAAPGTCHGFFPVPLLVGVWGGRDSLGFFWEVLRFFSLKGKKEDIPLSPRNRTCKEGPEGLISP